MEIPEEHTKPFETSRQDEVTRVNRSIETVNILIFLLGALMASVIYASEMGAFGLRGLFHLYETTIQIALPAASVMIPLVLTRAYPQSIHRLKALSREISLRPRLNAIGAISLIIALNYLYAIYFKWHTSIVIVLIGAYLLAAILPVRTVFGCDIKPPSLWSFKEISGKITLLFLAIFAAGEMWNEVIPPHYVFEYLGIENFNASVLTMTILIPFYASYLLSSLPEASAKLTHGITDDDLTTRFKS